MAAARDHSAVLKRIARERLEPLGLIQQGRSRVWFDDHAWFVTTVCFESSAWSKGSYLTVAASWLWWPGTDAVSFDYPERSRVHDFESADDGDWAEKCGSLADDAAKHVLAMRGALPDIFTASAVLNRQKFRRFDQWRLAHAGVAAALAGDVLLARRRFESVESFDVSIEWERQLQATLTALGEALGDIDTFREARIADIQAARQRVGLPALDDVVIREGLMARTDQGERRDGIVATLRGLFGRD